MFAVGLWLCVCVCCCMCAPVWACMLQMFCVMPRLSGNNISIGFQGLIERFGGRLRGHMLIVLVSQKHIPLEFSLYTGFQTSPSDKKKREKVWGSKAIHFILSFSKDAMLCFNLCRKGYKRQCNKAKRSFCSYQMAFHSWPLRCHSRNWRQCEKYRSDFRDQTPPLYSLLAWRRKNSLSQPIIWT